MKVYEKGRKSVTSDGKREKQVHFLFWFCNLFIAEFLHARSGVPWVREFGYLYIQEILVLRKSSVRSSVGNLTLSCKPG